ncbi:unnamed protein product [Spirodela intermedia]|uniref:Uncharacterized protein n=2 Tax=Spirodela intermedia TaxID=51605 RepID=A0A7I8JT72_SPIIN|nr:unnamed protein product [Spirodela intermedia]CAA6672632.1 unnamed protein product [Spirodela intermedia]CAA7409857.1 unnamed protein product [Spirodela intermedia]
MYSDWLSGCSILFESLCGWFDGEIGHLLKNKNRDIWGSR